MSSVTLDELEELALAAKADLYVDDGKDVTIAVEEHNQAFESAPIIVQEDGTIYLGSEIGGCPEIRIAADFESEPTEEQSEAIASAIAVIVDAFSMELDEEHLMLPESFEKDAIIERVDWLLECGLENA